MNRKRTILFLSQWFPFPADNGSKLRVRSLLSGLAQHYEVILISFADRLPSAGDAAEARAICRELHVVPRKPYDGRSLKSRLGYFSLTPRSLRDTYSPAMAQRVREAVTTRRPDLIVASQLGAAVYHPYFDGSPALFEEVEAGLLYEPYSSARSAWDAARNGLTWWKHRRLLAAVLRRFQQCTVVSDQERTLLLRIVPPGTGIEIVPNCIQLSDYLDVAAIPEPDTLIFTGSFSHYPNYEGIVWFLDKVYPRIKARIPTARLTITGRNNADYPLPAAADVVQAGFIEDVRPLVAGSAVSVAPVLSGGGTRSKILEAMALRTPVVATRKGAEGLAVEHDANILIADTPDEFAEHVVRLLHAPGARQRLANNAYRLIQSKYDWSMIMPRFTGLVAELIAGKDAQRVRCSQTGSGAGP